MILAIDKGMTTRENKADWKAVVLVIIATLGAFQNNVAGRINLKVVKTAIAQEIN